MTYGLFQGLGSEQFLQYFDAAGVWDYRRSHDIQGLLLTVSSLRRDSKMEDKCCEQREEPQKKQAEGTNGKVFTASWESSASLLFMVYYN